MKKALLALMVMCLALAVFSCASTGGSSSSGSAAPAQPVGDLGSFRLQMADAFEWAEPGEGGYQGNITNVNALGPGNKFAVGEVYTLKFTYTASRDLEAPMEVYFVDQTEQASWWNMLTVADEERSVPIISKAGEVVSATLTFNIIANPVNATTMANSIVFATGGEGTPGRKGSGVKKPFSLEFTEFVLTKVQ